MRYTRDGAPISSAVPIGKKKHEEHKNLFGIYRGQIVRVVYPDDPKNISKDRIEYVVKVKGQKFPNAIDMKELGAKYNWSETIRKETEVSESGQLNDKTYDELTDGEHVYVAFLEGYGNFPLILGAAEHQQRGKYKKFKKADGRFSYREFQGVEVGTDKDGNYTIKHVGLKDAKGKIADEKAVGAMLKLFGNGNILLDANKTASDKALSVLLDKAGKKLQIDAQENQVLMDDAGIKITDKSGNIVEMKNGEVKITVAGNLKLAIDGNVEVAATGDAKIQAGGDAEVKADGKAKFVGTGGTDVGAAASPTKVEGVTVALAEGTLPVARLNDLVQVYVLGVPQVGNILQGSPKVKSG